MAYNIAMVCDFFYPQLGGVEFHIYHLSQKLIKLGHSVVVITHAYGDRTGVRYLSNGLKVYYVPYVVVYRETTIPTVFGSLPIVRNILIREQIQIVHSHVSVSSLAHESLLHGTVMGLETVFTDHSLYGFDSVNSIIVNKLLRFTLTNVGAVICVSNTCKENMALRARIDPSQISVIPNAVVSQDFTPLPKKSTRVPGQITIVVISRLYPNKGADLLTHLIPKICKIQQNVNFIVGGDGPKFVDFQQMIETFRLHDRVQLVGAVQHENVRDVMCQGDIYLHASLTEAFGTALVEASSCGLLIVTTTVGGIPEVLPKHMTVFADKTSVSSLVDATLRAINLLQENKVDTSLFHSEVASMYDWTDVAKRTVVVYRNLIQQSAFKDKSWLQLLKNFNYRDRPWARCLYTLCALVEYMFFIALEWWYPRDQIDLACKWATKEH
ncbi:LANO_0H16424g1_1 [Lachancea nothofagi CBS 11611]|uniref:Phosphatidylinositol N-acetylglucosaminyltransferase GPI3 subunit n=1 Tax=Lachancea nothofagi CBS 11611 TaxID=1266666 RepID=A0A1G4KMQ5_9SACH|nr:LANO_0H16424g1_1 [Lachancea nothofagi CBS 11611]